jgi:hypothetical protein
VLLHTLGGSPDAAYMLVQIIHEFAHSVNFLIPYQAASAGTLACFCGNMILLGAYAYLSPIDIKIGNFPLMSIDYFMDFAVECRRKLELEFKKMNIMAGSNVESDVLVQMVKQISSIQIGKLYRQRRLTAYYANLLLSSYMFVDNPDAQSIAEKISYTMIFDYPSHDFMMDFYMCRKLGLRVEQMTEGQSDLSKYMVRILDYLTKTGVVCKKVKKDLRVPFIRLYG